MIEHVVQIRATGTRGTVTIDGHELGGLTRTVGVSWTAGDLPVVTLGLLAHAADLDLEAAHVAIDDETRKLLERLGWTPPGAADLPTLRARLGELARAWREDESAVGGYADALQECADVLDELLDACDCERECLCPRLGR